MYAVSVLCTQYIQSLLELISLDDQNSCVPPK